tara:strand:+ start:2102 stop:2881 length:780 start_codon:yes stop_codon:yes gene_type:complete
VKILSIDLDFISEPAIHHNKIDGDLRDMEGYDMWPVIKWAELFEDHPGEFTHKISVENYQYCLRTYLKALRNCTDVRFGYDHDNILYGLEGHSDIEIINIDHHDDIFSGCFGEGPQDEITTLKTYDRVMEGNWGMWLQTQNRLKSFTWIGNKSSHNTVHIPYAEKYINNFKFCTKDEYDFGDYKFDQIFVCISPGYIPPLQWHMIGTFMTVYEEITGNVVDLNEFNKKYEIEKYYAQVTDYITKGTTIGKGSPSARFIY